MTRRLRYRLIRWLGGLPPSATWTVSTGHNTATTYQFDGVEWRRV